MNGTHYLDLSSYPQFSLILYYGCVTKARSCATEMKIQMKSLSKFEAFIMKKQQNQDSLIIVAKVRKDIISTIYDVIFIGQSCK
jgi:hypothetical protein